MAVRLPAPEGQVPADPPAAKTPHGALFRGVVRGGVGSETAHFWDSITTYIRRLGDGLRLVFDRLFCVVHLRDDFFLEPSRSTCRAGAGGNYLRRAVTILSHSAGISSGLEAGFPALVYQ